jgi:hypothetical protein
MLYCHHKNTEVFNYISPTTPLYIYTCL